tara:strand:- start:1097 stop:1531 length:435 start_codon:yes stop_codon:yes gene_type:complete
MLPNLSGLCNRNETPVGAPPWFDEVEWNHSQAVRSQSNTYVEFAFQVLNEINKYEKGKYDPVLTLEKVVVRLLNYWRSVEGFTPDMLMGLLIGVLTSSDLEGHRSTKFEVLNAAKTWLRGAKGGLTYAEEANINQAIRSSFGDT